jgi:hypothetical protein
MKPKDTINTAKTVTPTNHNNEFLRKMRFRIEHFSKSPI